MCRYNLNRRKVRRLVGAPNGGYQNKPPEKQISNVSLWKVSIEKPLKWKLKTHG